MVAKLKFYTEPSIPTPGSLLTCDPGKAFYDVVPGKDVFVYLFNALKPPYAYGGGGLNYVLGCPICIVTPNPGKYHFVQLAKSSTNMAYRTPTLGSLKSPGGISEVPPGGGGTKWALDVLSFTPRGLNPVEYVHALFDVYDSQAFATPPPLDPVGWRILMTKFWDPGPEIPTQNPEYVSKSIGNIWGMSDTPGIRNVKFVDAVPPDDPKQYMKYPSGFTFEPDNISGDWSFLTGIYDETSAPQLIVAIEWGFSFSGKYERLYKKEDPAKDFTQWVMFYLDKATVTPVGPKLVDTKTFLAAVGATTQTVRGAPVPKVPNWSRPF